MSKKSSPVSPPDLNIGEKGTITVGAAATDRGSASSLRLRGKFLEKKETAHPSELLFRWIKLGRDTILPIGGRPVYCYQCRGRNTFEHQPKNDIKSEATGEVLWEAWRCKVCGNSTVKLKGGKK